MWQFILEVALALKMVYQCNVRPFSLPTVFIENEANDADSDNNDDDDAIRIAEPNNMNLIQP